MNKSRINNIFIIIVLSIIKFNIVCAQVCTNLVPNGGFEMFDTCPATFGQLNYASGWFRPTLGGTSDYFNSCSNSDSIGIPSSYFNATNAYEGNGMAGLYTSLGHTNHDVNSPELVQYDPNYYKEYISTKLNSKLNKNKLYNICFNVLLSSKSTGGSTVGLYLSDTLVYYDSIYYPPPFGFNVGYCKTLPFKPQLESNSHLIEYNKWTSIHGTYRAKGTEEFIIIGCFDSAKYSSFTYLVPIPPANIAIYTFPIYYFIDDVSISEVPEENILPVDTAICDSIPFQYSLSTLYNLGNLLWSTGETTSVINITEPGNYWCKTYCGCDIIIDTINISQKTCKAQLQESPIPNILTPNGDGKNDLWRIFEGANLKNLEIFNRWGELVYKNEGKIVSWDGKTQAGNDCEEGVYYFVLYRGTKVETGILQLIK